MFKGNRSAIRSSDKSDIYPIYLNKQADRKGFEQGLRLFHRNVCQIL